MRRSLSSAAILPWCGSLLKKLRSRRWQRRLWSNAQCAGVYGHLLPRLSRVYASARVGDPREADTLVGPLIDRRAFESMQQALQETRALGGTVHGGERIETIAGKDA